jgi:2-phosphosulfolactate phosphatase
MPMAFSEWGAAGIESLRGRVSALVIVDVLSFSTAVDVAVSRGARIYPYPVDNPEGAEAVAKRVGGMLATPRDRTCGGFSLSPVSLKTIPEG